MTIRRVPHGLILVVVGLLAPLAVSAALVPVRARVNGTDAALLLVTVIVGIATGGQRSAGVAAALSSSLWFDFFHTKPYEHFSIGRSADVQTTALLLVVGVAVTELAARGRQQRAIAREGANYLAMVHDFAELVATGESSQFVIIRAAAELTELLHLRDCRFEDAPAPRHAAQLEPGGQVTMSGVRWDVEDLGLPGREVELLVESRGRAFGRFVLVPTPGERVSLGRRVVAVALADQVGAALSGASETD